MIRLPRAPLAIALLGLAALALAIATASADATSAAASGLMFLMAAGAASAWLVAPNRDIDLTERLALAIAGSFALIILLGLALIALPAPLTTLLVAVPFVLTLAVATVAASLLGARTDPRPRGAPLILLTMVMLPTIVLRFAGIGYSEFQGDEAEVILRALGAVRNVPDALFHHGKGPAEIVIIALLYGLNGTLNEAGARLPFAMASLGGVLAIFILARRLSGTSAGVAAALALAINGFYVAFARITQYQSIVLLMTVMATWSTVLWCDHRRVRYAVLAGLFSATGALAHFDAVFVLAPIAAIALAQGRPLARAVMLRHWGTAGMIGGAVTLSYFGPYRLNPLYTAVSDRFGDRVGQLALHNNLAGLLATSALYTSPLYLMVIAATMIAGVAHLAIARRRGARDALWLAGALWLLGPLLFYGVVARKPGTHIHVAFVGAALLCGVAVAATWRSPLSRIALALVAVITAAGVIAYVGPVFLQTSPELVRSGRLPAMPFASLMGESILRKERFGFPYQAGWKAVAALYRDRAIDGSFDSNENPQITHWYTRGAWRCTANPRLYIIADQVQDELEPPRRRIATDYHETYTVTVNGQPRLRIHEPGPSASPARVIAAEQFAGRFDRELSLPDLEPGVWARGPVNPLATPAPVRFGDAIELIGYDLYLEDPRPGGVVRMDLYWRPLISSRAAHTIDLSAGAAADGNGPGCDKTRAAQEWDAGRPFVQRASLTVAESAATGRHPLTLAVATSGGRRLTPTTTLPTAGDAAEIGSIEITVARQAR
ncbi:MAG: glycosyltransferase family 39 protein [Chloroflexota bacterium]